MAAEPDMLFRQAFDPVHQRHGFQVMVSTMLRKG